MDELRAGRLVEILPASRMPDADILAIPGPREGRPPRMACFADILKQALKPVPWRQG
ncbi:hypothetical protein [Aureimonas sp. ME7]|uniref:hypothetical protein n=1 Tax=Aureimonas sp. ME7 TaxID=2744252 RepID=UPI0015F45383|nr:hypothetical protein [Aureimonas sp. ME7]